MCDCKLLSEERDVGRRGSAGSKLFTVRTRCTGAVMKHSAVGCAWSLGDGEDKEAGLVVDAAREAVLEELSAVDGR